MVYSVVEFCVQIITDNKGKLLKKVLPHLSITYFITESRGGTAGCELEEREDKGAKRVLPSTGDALGPHYVFSSFFLPSLSIR
jgi:hypothetical protein